MSVFHNGKEDQYLPAFILDRLKELLGFENDKDLADELGVKANTLSSWRTRDTIDYQRVFVLCLRKGYSLNYVILGNGQRLVNNVDDINVEVKLEDISFERLAQMMETVANDQALLLAFLKNKIHKEGEPNGVTFTKNEIIDQGHSKLSRLQLKRASNSDMQFDVNDEPPG